MLSLFSPKEKEDLKGVEASERDEEASPQAWIGADSDPAPWRTTPSSLPAPGPCPHCLGATLLNAVRWAPWWNTPVGLYGGSCVRPSHSSWASGNPGITH